MTPEEFHQNYYNWQTIWDTDAEAKANELNAIGVDGERVVAVQLGDHGMWALILRSSAAFYKRMGEV
jgi:hypothetical protein